MKLSNFQKGFTAIELMVVIIVGLGLFIWAANNTDLLFGNSDLTEEVRNVQNLYVNTKAIKTSSGYGTSGADIVPSLVSTGGIPKNMSLVSNVPYNVWGGVVGITSTGAGFNINYANVPNADCVKIAAKVSKGAVFYSTSINGNAAIAGEVPSATATTQCASGNNTISWLANS